VSGSARRPRAHWPLSLALLPIAAVAASDAPEPWVVTDDTGARVTLAAPARRIVALAPSATALLFAAGAGDRVVATIEWADDPPEAQRLPRIGDAQSIDAERLVALRPDAVVVTETITSPLVVDRVASLGFPLYRTRSRSLAELAPSIARLGRLTDTETVALAAAARIEADLAALRREFAGRATLSVLYQVWSHPIYTIGGRHVITDALGVCGARNAFADQPVPAPAVAVEAVIARNPDVIVASGPADVAAGWVAEWQRFPRLAATANGRVLVYSDLRLDRMGPSAIDATRTLCELIDRAR
jgi:iron complex transport system substrate-binding protein